MFLSKRVFLNDCDINNVTINSIINAREVNNMDIKLLSAQFSQLSDYQKESISRVMLDYIEQNASDDRIFPEICPTCGKEHARFNKAGIVKGKQRIKCKECGKTFVYTKGRLTYWSHQGKDIWNKVILDTLNAVALCDTAAEINVTITNVFYMRHKILIFLEEMVNCDSHLLSGIVEDDETYVNDAYKGRFQKWNRDRRPRKHGGTASKRGISGEKICILTASDRNGHEIIKAVGRAKPTTVSIMTVLSKRIMKKSVCVNDGVFSYDCLIKENQLESRIVSSKDEYTPVYHLNTVNSMHSEWKKLWRYYKGVSTKYLNRYLSLFLFMRKYMGMDRQEQYQDINQRLNRVCLILPVRVVKLYNLLTI